MTLPKRLYYPINLAASKLGCTSSDLIHFGATSSVEIGIHTSFYESYIDIDVVSSGISKVMDREQIYFEGRYNTFSIIRDDKHFYINDFYGLAAVSQADLLAFDFNPEQIVTLNQFLSPNGNGVFFDEISGCLRIEPDFQYLEKVKLSDVINRLFITDVELEKLMADSDNQSSPSLPSVNKKVSTKTKNSQAKFIKSLLQIHYGADVANSPRQHLEMKSSGAGVILSDFENIGLKAPTGVAVDNWLKFIDIMDDD